MPGTNTNDFSHFKLAELGSNKATEDRRFLQAACALLFTAKYQKRQPTVKKLLHV